MLEMLTFMAAPFAACLILVGVHGYLGLHVLLRQVIFVDLALAQIAALGTVVAFLMGHEPGSPASLRAVESRSYNAATRSESCCASRIESGSVDAGRAAATGTDEGWGRETGGMCSRGAGDAARAGSPDSAGVIAASRPGIGA